MADEPSFGQASYDEYRHGRQDEAGLVKVYKGKTRQARLGLTRTAVKRHGKADLTRSA